MSIKSISAISLSVFSLAALIVLVLTSGLRAPQQQAHDKNGPGVVRVSVVQGSAVVERGDSHVQTSAVRNAPMLPGDYISTGNGSLAELQFDGYTAVRLGGDAQARIADNDSENRRVQLANGTIEIGMVHDAQVMQVDTPSVTVRAHQAGDYRISTAADGSSWVTARRGSVDVVTPQRTYTFGPGKTLIARGSASDPSVTYGPEVAFDGFDDFNVDRDNAMVAALNASPNLSPSLAGYENLDAYGQWQAVAGYGRSWVPNEPNGWAPYRNGSWVWEGGYGWTWLGAEPWGWTPYHYGNWYYCGCGSSGWAWLPPSSGATPAWSPALVGFFGFDVADATYNPCGTNYGPSSSGGYGPGSYTEPASYGNAPPPAAPYGQGGPAPYGVGGPDNGSPEAPYGEGSGSPPPPGYSYPNIGWVPIAPYQPFYPWYPGWAWIGVGWGFPFFGGYGYPARFTTHITNITNIVSYRNFRYGGATATTMRNFRHGTVYGHTAPVTGRNIGRRSGTIHGALPVTPTRDNLTFSHGSLHGDSIAKAFDSPRFASDRALAARNSFAQQQKAVAQAVHDGLVGHPSAHAAASHASASVARANAPANRTHVAMNRASAPMTRANAPEARANEYQSRANEYQSRANGSETRASAYQGREARPTMRQNAAAPREIEASRSEYRPESRQNAPVTRENAAPAERANAAPAERANAAPMVRGEDDATTRENSETMPESRNESAPASSWDRFSEARGDTGIRQSEVSPARDGGQEGRAPSDPWAHFSDSRGEAYQTERDPYAGRDPYAERGSYPSYSRGSYPSYSRGSYPSYSHGSYSAPAYSRGSYGGYGPSYSRGYSAPPRSYGGSGGGGSGTRQGGGGRPPQ